MADFGFQDDDGFDWLDDEGFDFVDTASESFRWGSVAHEVLAATVACEVL